jgi:hypothetical protein
MCLFGAWQSAYEVYYYFKHPMELEPEPMEGPAHAQGVSVNELAVTLTLRRWSSSSCP